MYVYLSKAEADMALTLAVVFVEISVLTMPLSLVSADPAVQLLTVNLLEHRTTVSERPELSPRGIAENICLLVNLVQDTNKNIPPNFVAVVSCSFQQTQLISCLFEQFLHGACALGGLYNAVTVDIWKAKSSNLLFFHKIVVFQSNIS